MRKLDSLLVLIALPLGLLLWLLLYGVGGLSQGAALPIRLLVYLAPLGASVPCAWALMRSGRTGAGLMLIALTPVASALNVLVFIALSGSVSGSAMQAGLAAIGLWVGWQCPWLVPLIRKRQTSPSAQAGRINP